MLTDPRSNNTTILQGIFGLVQTLVVELRQYGIAAVVMVICMGALGWLFVTFEGVRERKDGEIRALNEKVFTAFTENTKALDELRSEIKRK